MEEGYELDLTYVTERIIAVSFPRACSEDIYLHNLKDVTRMLKSKHADNYLIINLSEKRHDLSKMNPKTLDTGWPDLHAPPLDKICTICKAMENWLNADPLHVVVIHCRGGKGRIGVVISSFVHFTDISASADQALDRFAMRKYYDDKVSALMTPSQKRYVWILNSLLSGSMKINASPLFLHCIILHGIPNFDTAGVCRPYLKVYQGMQAVYSSGVYHIGPGHRDRICISLEPAQMLKGDIMVKCYHKSDVTLEREVIFRLQFHTGAVQGYNMMFEKEDMETANKDRRFLDYGKVELVFSEGPEKIPGAERWQNGADVSVDYNTADPLTRWDSYQNIIDAEAAPLSGGDVRVDAMRSRQGSDVTHHPGSCGSHWGVQEEYKSTRTYSPCVPHSQHGMLFRSGSVDYRGQGPEMDSGVEAGSDITPTPAFPISPPTPYVKNMAELTHLRQTPSPSMQSNGAYRTEHEPRGYLEMIGHVPQSAEEGLPDSSPSCHMSFGSSRSEFISGMPQRTDSPSMGQPWPEDRALLPHSMSLDYGHHSPPMHPHPHPAPNAHSSPQGSQQSHMAHYGLTHSLAHSFDEQDNLGLGGYGAANCPPSASPLLGNGGMERGLSIMGSMDGQGTIRTQHLPQLQQMQQLQAQGALPPQLPEKRRESYGEHSLGTASPAPSGFSSPHSGSSLSIPFPNILPDLSASAQMPGTASPLPGKPLAYTVISQSFLI
uniref:Tensin 3 n=1 Tax=Hucho hucho TaxID=62062 RepID=A0A4W5MI16_9TELE